MVFANVFALLGFRMVFFGLGIGLGWDSSDEMERSAYSSALILVGYFWIKFCSNMPDRVINPFKSAVCVLGSNILFLAMLILSSRYYSKNSRTSSRYFLLNTLYIFLLV